MSAPQFDVVFRGVREGFDPGLVKTQFGGLFKLDAAIVERIFSAKKITLKTNVDERVANVLVARLLAIGVVADKLVVHKIASKAIYHKDTEDVSPDAQSMHQFVEPLYGEHIRRIPLVFNGNGWGYFKIWIVNVLVCILSAGILYPWARVRTLRYFYEHTYLDHVEFQFKSDPQKILLTQLLVLLFILSLGFLFALKLWFGVLCLLLLISLYPLYWLRLSSYHYRHSLYCGAKFKSSMSTVDAYRIYLLWPLIALLSLGLAAPWAIYNFQKYRIESVTLGGNRFSFVATPKSYVFMLFPLVIAELLSASCVYFRDMIPALFAVPLLLAVWLFVLVHIRIAVENMRWNFTKTKLGAFESSWELSNYKTLIIKNLVLCVLTLGLYWPWAKVDIARYKASRLAFFANQRFAKWRKKLMANNWDRMI